MRRLAPLLVLLLLAALGCARPTAPTTYAGAEIKGLYHLPGTRLVDTRGHARELRATKPITVLFFGYASCPDVCTGIVADLASARNRLSDRDRGDVEVVVVTTDPARDTPSAWGAYLARIDPDLVGLTGELTDIVAAGRAVGVDIAQGTPLPSGGYEVDHGAQVLAFDRTGSSVLVWTTGKSVGDVRADLERLLATYR